MYSLLFLFIGLASADLLQNPDFESPPIGFPENNTAQFVLLNENNTIPGWTFEGTVKYVTAGQAMRLPDNGHALQLGEDGKINQTFIAENDYMHYLLTFTLVPSADNCSGNADIAVSGPDSHGVFSLKKSYGKEGWVSYAHYLGHLGEREPIDLVIETQIADLDPNSTCWPVIDNLLLKSIPDFDQSDNNLLLNGGFELGPGFPSNSTDGVLLDPSPSPVQSVLLQWSIAGTVRYIDSKHFLVPQGKAGIEIVSGVSAGIQTATNLKEGSSYNLEFNLGDANDSCEGKFIVGAQAGSTLQNFTLLSNGTGSSKKFVMGFKAGSNPNHVSFLSYTTSQTKDHVFCGPVIDDVVLRSHGFKLEIRRELLVTLLLLVAIL